MLAQLAAAYEGSRRSAWIHAAVLLAAVWGSVWSAGEAGGRLGIHLYESSGAPAAPYSARQIRSLDRASVDAAEVARRDLRLWQTSVEVGREVARIQGSTAGSLLVLAGWTLAGLRWMWLRRRIGRAAIG